MGTGWRCCSSKPLHDTGAEGCHMGPDIGGIGSFMSDLIPAAKSSSDLYRGQPSRGG